METSVASSECYIMFHFGHDESKSFAEALSMQQHQSKSKTKTVYLPLVKSF